MSYLRVRNWETFQHYKNRNPPWIKNYTELLNDEAYLNLSLATRGLLHGIWLEYASSRQKLPENTLGLSRRLGQKVSRSQLESLEQAGFIALGASKPLAGRKQPASPHARPRARAEGEAEGDKETPKGVTPTSTPHAHRTGLNGLPFAQELILQKIITAIGADADNGTPQVLRRYAVHLPEAALAKVAESISSSGKRDKASYAVAALKSECHERGIQVK